MRKFFESTLQWVAKHFHEDASKMLIATGVLGWVLSSGAQIGAILVNKKISDKEKSFLLPQEIADALVNIGLFLAFTTVTKHTVSKLFSTGKWTTKNVRDFINKNPNIFKDKIGKIDYVLGDTLSKIAPALRSEHEVAKNLGTTLTTVGAGIIASNVITPVVRNNKAAKVQKKYINYKNNNPYPANYSGNMKV